jgi:hypothetical protein
MDSSEFDQGNVINIDLGDGPAQNMFDIKEVCEFREGESGFLMPQAVLVGPDGTLWMRRESLACDTPSRTLTLRVVRHGDEIHIDHPVESKDLRPVGDKAAETLMPVRVCTQ